MWKNYLLVGGLVILLSACVSSGRIGKIPEVSDKGGVATIEVLRISSFVGALNTYKVFFDGKDVAGIGSGERFSFRIDPSEHYIGVKCFGGFSPTWKKDALRFLATKNATYYFKISPNLSCASIEQIDQTQAIQLAKGTKLLFRN